MRVPKMKVQNENQTNKVKSKNIVNFDILKVAMHHTTAKSNNKEEPLQIIEEKCPHTGVILNRYSKGRRLGKGGFAVCHEVLNLKTNKKSAAKIIDKSTLTKSKAKEKLASEIKIHSEIHSEYVVKYEHFFEDSNFVYIILELCDNQTLNELVKRRKRLTEVEAKYYMHQLIVAVKDIHSEGVIHRDLKLGNLLLTDKLQVRVGDFGLAAKVVSRHQRRKTMCGTPNYIAPEILDNTNGHSFEVDVWSLGVIAYALVVGRPPFETSDVKTTYTKIKNCNYCYPEAIQVSECCRNFISKMLQRDPSHRATVEEMLNDDFFTCTPFPSTLPMSTLACPPNANFLKQFTLTTPALMMKKSRDSYSGTETDFTNSTAQQEPMKTDRNLSRNNSRRTIVRASSTDRIGADGAQVKRAASTAALIKNVPSNSVRIYQKEKLEKARHGPLVWVVYSEENKKFGVSYMLNSNAIGMKYNDSTILISNHQFEAFKYFDYIGYKQGVPISQVEKVYAAGEIPPTLAKKFKIIDYYRKQLKQKKDEDEGRLCNDQIIRKERERFRESAESAMSVFVVKYEINSNVRIFWFNTKDCQVIFKDSTELLLSKDHVTYVDKVGKRRYFLREDLSSQAEEVKKRMNYAELVMETLRKEHPAKSAVNSHQNSQKEAEDKENRGTTNGLNRKSSVVSITSSSNPLKTMTRSNSMHRMEKTEKSNLLGNRNFQNQALLSRGSRGSASTNRLHSRFA